jgi:hypothetical protein
MYITYSEALRFMRTFATFGTRTHYCILPFASIYKGLAPVYDSLHLQAVSKRSLHIICYYPVPKAGSVHDAYRISL